MTKMTKMMDKGMDYGSHAMKMAKHHGPKMAHMAMDHMPSKHDLAKMKMKADAHLAKGAYKAMPAKVKKMELAKMLILPAAGAAAALLFAPQSGRELRSRIKHSFGKAKDRGMEEAHGLMDKAKEVSEDMMPEDGSLDSMLNRDIDTPANVGDTPHGNVHGTPYEPHHDETVPADKLDEALEDVGASSEDELLMDDKDRPDLANK